MPNLREHFDNIDFSETRTESSETTIKFEPDHREFSIQVRLHRNEELKAFVSIFCPGNLSNAEEQWFFGQKLPELVSERRSRTQEFRFPEYTFSNDVFVYAEGNYQENIRTESGLTIIRRGPHYCKLMADLNALIGIFMTEYIEADFESHKVVAEYVRSRIEKILRENNVLAIVSARAKDPQRLQEKILKRAIPFESGKQYRTVADIYADVVDLAGIRVALYFPGDREAATDLLMKAFELTKIEGIDNPKHFPEPIKSGNRKPRFCGYRATHLRIRVPFQELKDLHMRRRPIEYPIKKKDGTTEIGKSFGFERVESDRYFLAEVQVASVIMHAWAEVDHDLQYKQRDGVLSFLELDMLEQLNGLALAGEISLEQLQIARNARLAKDSLERKL